MKKIYCFILAFLAIQMLFAQVFTNTYPEPKVSKKGLFGKTYKVKTHILPEIDSSEINREIKASNLDKTFRFAKVRYVDLSISSGDWEMISEDTTVWRLKIVSKKALSITVNFDRFYLTDDAEMYIYNEEGTMITGPITSKENNPENVWGSSIYKGEGVVIEVKVPVKSKDKIILHINSIAHGYKKIFIDKTFGESGTCNINVLCSLGNGWDNERNSVALVLNAAGNEHCSGAMIMNTCNTDRPLFLTANHCYAASPTVGNWRFIFQYWSPTCTPNQDGSRAVLFNGSVLRANSAASDFALLELNQFPPLNSGIAYSGWSRSTTAPASTTGIHHPSGDVMKISRDNVAPVKTNYPNSSGNNHWRVDWDNGVTEGGSSGSPLYDPNHRIIGQLHGGYSSCTSSDLRDWYGAFDISWTGGGTNATRLSNWLDPNNSGAVVTNSTPVNNLISVNPLNYSISGPAQFCTSGNYSINNLPAGATLQWVVTPIYGQQSQSVSNNVLSLTRVTDGSASVSAIITICGNTVQVPARTVQIGGTVITVSATQTECNTVQFNVSGAASGASYNWSSNGNTILYNGTSTTATTATGQIDAVITGYDIPIVTTTNTCGQAVSVGGYYNPYDRQIQGLYPEYTSGDHVSVSVNTTPYDTYYRWYINNILVKEGSDAYYYCTCYYETPDARVCGDNTIRVEVETSCGIPSSFDAGFYRICGYFRTQSNVELFPNPARDQVTVKLKQINAKQTMGQLKDIREVRILNKVGSVKRIVKYPANTNTISVNISNLPLDIYYVEVTDGRNSARLPLSIVK